MNTRTSTQTGHPTIGALSLYAGGDLSWAKQMRIKWHIKRCASCDRQVLRLGAARTELKREAEAQTLTGFEAIADWSRLEREIVGNIAVGVAAARCIDHVGHGRVLLVRAAFCIGLLGLFVAGWVTHIPREQSQHLWASLHGWMGTESSPSGGIVLRSSPNGIAVRAQGSTLTLMHPRSAVISVSGATAVEARYIDEETGQVTITSVYGQ